MCGWIRPRKNYAGKDEVRLNDVDTLKVQVWQKKKVGGYASGFKVIDSAGLADAPPEIKDQIRSQAQAILDALEG